MSFRSRYQSPDGIFLKMMNSWEGSRAGDENLMPKKYMQKEADWLHSVRGNAGEKKEWLEKATGNKSAS